MRLFSRVEVIITLNGLFTTFFLRLQVHEGKAKSKITILIITFHIHIFFTLITFGLILE